MEVNGNIHNQLAGDTEENSASRIAPLATMKNVKTQVNEIKRKKKNCIHIGRAL